MSDESNIHAECETQDCFLPSSRRRFLRDSFLSVAGALVAVGMSKTDAFAMPLSVTEVLHTSGSTKSYALPAVDGAQIDKDSEVIVVRWQNAVYAFALSCPHQNTALKYDDKEHTFQCPKHHSKFQPNGDYIPDSGRATRNMDRFAISRTAAGITVDLDKLYQEDTDTAQWTAAFVKPA
ncbi:MAG: Rieske 2Fe-2S domain-containing protein [Gemmatimonadaceae bacterium]